MITLGKMPRPDGAPFYCTVFFHDGEECPREGVGMMTPDERLDLVTARNRLMTHQPKSIWPMYFGRVICQPHLKVANEMLNLAARLNKGE